MTKVVNKVEILSQDDKMIGLYDAEKIAEKVKNTQIKNAKKEGIKEGIEKGILKGLNQKSIEIANNLLKENIDINIISKVTNLSIKDIKNLK